MRIHADPNPDLYEDIYGSIRIRLKTNKDPQDWLYWIGLKNVRSGIGQLRIMFEVVLDNSEKFSELSNTTPNIFPSCPIPLRTIFQVVQYPSEHFSELSNTTQKKKVMTDKICSEWYWTTPNIFLGCPIPLRTLFGVVQYHSEHYSIRSCPIPL